MVCHDKHIRLRGNRNISLVAEKFSTRISSEFFEELSTEMFLTRDYIAGVGCKLWTLFYFQICHD